MPDKFLIFSLARCGSETLVSALNCHPQIRIVSEPFNPDNFGGQFLKRVIDPESLHAALDDLWRDFSGLKHVWDPSGWPFSRREPLNRSLLQRPCKVIFLTRFNSLRRVVSLLIAAQTKKWGVFTAADRATVEGFRFEPMDASVVRWHLEGERKLLPTYRRILQDANIPTLELTYEQLYGAERTLTQRLETINELFAFLGKAPLPEAEFTERLCALLAHRQTAVDASSLYFGIPNIASIEKLFGSTESGYLFDELARSTSAPEIAEAAVQPR